MKAPRFIASGLSFKSKAALVSTALSLCVMIIAVCISMGFEKELRRAISENFAEITMQGETASQHLCDSISALPYVESATKAMAMESILKNENLMQGVLIKSSDKAASDKEILLPRRLATMLKVQQGDSLLAYFFDKKLKVRNFVVGEIQPDLAELEHDSFVVLTSYGCLKRLAGNENDSFVEVRLEEDFRDRESINLTCQSLGFGTEMYCVPSTRRFASLYDWLEILKVTVLLLLSLMALVAAFNMISAFLILIMRSRSTIGLLKTLGMSSSKVSACFLLLCSKAVVEGLLIGDLLGIGLCLLQKYTHIIKLDPFNYFVSYVPIEFNWLLIVMLNIFAWAAIMLFVLLPARRIQKTDPASSVKGESL